MKFRATFSSVGVQWLERFVPVFDKLGKELSVLLTPNTLHLVQDAVASGGLELHADLLKDEVFDEYKIASNNADKIAFALEPATLHRVLRGLIGSEATHVEVKLIKRTVAPGKASPFLNFSSKGVVDITQDVPLAGPLTKRQRACSRRAGTFADRGGIGGRGLRVLAQRCCAVRRGQGAKAEGGRVRAGGHCAGADSR